MRRNLHSRQEHPHDRRGHEPVAPAHDRRHDDPQVSAEDPTRLYPHYQGPRCGVFTARRTQPARPVAPAAAKFEGTMGPRCAGCGDYGDYAELACPRVWTLNDVSLAPTRKVYRLIRAAISPSGVLASTFSRVSLRC